MPSVEELARLYLADLKATKYADAPTNYRTRRNLCTVTGETEAVIEHAGRHRDHLNGFAVRAVQKHDGLAHHKRRRLKAILNWALDQRPPLITDHFFLHLQRRETRERIFPKTRSVADFPPYRITNEIVAAITAKMPEPYRPAPWLSLGCGPRPTEASAVLKTEVERRADGPLLRLRADRTKDSDERAVPIPRALMPMIDGAVAASKSARVFDGARGGNLAFNIGGEWAKAADAAGYPEVKFKHLRSEWAIRCVEHGMNLVVLQAFGGWCSLDLVQRYAARAEFFYGSEKPRTPREAIDAAFGAIPVEVEAKWNGSAEPLEIAGRVKARKARHSTGGSVGAGNRDRTGDIQLGKLAFYR